MMRKILLITALILLSLEVISYSVLKLNGTETPFLIGLDLKKSNLEKLSKFNYDEIDPVLGWSIQIKHIEEEGYKSKQDLLLLDNYSDHCSNPYIVLITGGSTSDLIYNAENWPIYFEQQIAQKHPCYEIYIAAIGGYDSGQELLQLIKFQYAVIPDLHISYSACNDYINQGLASQYENSLWEEFMAKKPSIILPSTISWISSLSTKNSRPIKFAPSKRISPDLFWMKNQNSMKALALQNNATFIGVLQPVVNFSGFELDLAKAEPNLNLKYLDQYNSYYPSLIEFCKTDASIYDFTNVFEKATEQPFSDDCHLKNSYFQKIISSAIFGIVDTTTRVD